MNTTKELRAKIDLRCAMKRFTLEDLSKMYSHVIMDSCALTKHFYMQKRQTSDLNRSTIGKKIIEEKDSVKAVNFLREYLRKGGCFYVTPKIVEEVYESGRTISKEVDSFFYKLARISSSGKNALSEKYKQKNAPHIKNARRQARARKALARDLESNGKIIRLSKDEALLHTFLRVLHSDFQRVVSKRRNGVKRLADNDMDFLITGLTLTYARGPTAIVTNDFQISSTYKRLIIREGLYPNQFGNFFREDINSYGLIN